MKRNTQANDEKVLRYGLRKYKLGFGFCRPLELFLSFAAVQGGQGDGSSVNDRIKHTGRTTADSSLTTMVLVTETPAAPVTAESNSVSKAK